MSNVLFQMSSYSQRQSERFPLDVFPMNDPLMKNKGKVAHMALPGTGKPIVFQGRVHM